MEAEKPLGNLLACASGQPSAPPSFDPVPFPQYGPQLHPAQGQEFLELSSRLCYRSRGSLAALPGAMQSKDLTLILCVLAGETGACPPCCTEAPVLKTQGHLSASTPGGQMAHVQGGGATLRSSSSKPPYQAQ